MRKPLSLFVLLSTIGAVLTALPPAARASTYLVNPRTGLMPGAVPIIRPGQPFQVASSPQLTYYGGPVMSDAQVVSVVWGSGTYLSQVTDGTSPSFDTFFTHVTDSPYMAWRTEYNTNVTGGTNQTASRVHAARRGRVVRQDHVVKVQSVAAHGLGSGRGVVVRADGDARGLSVGVLNDFPSWEEQRIDRVVVARGVDGGGWQKPVVDLGK